MEGKRSKIWKNRRRKSIYTLESKDVGLLYRKVSEEPRRYLTRSQSRRKKHDEESSEVNDSVKKKHFNSSTVEYTEDTVPQDEAVNTLHGGEVDRDKSSTPTALGKSTASPYVCESGTVVRSQVKKMEQTSVKKTKPKSSTKKKKQTTTRKSSATNEVVNDEVTLCFDLSPHGSTVKDKAADGSIHLHDRVTNINEEQEKHLSELFCDHFIQVLKKDIGESAELDQEKFEESFSELKELLLSSNIFRNALEEPIVVLPPRLEDVEELQRTQENRQEKTRTELDGWKKLSDVLLEEEQASELDSEDSLSEDAFKALLSPDQLKILEDIREEVKGTDDYEAAIAQTDQLLKAVQDQVQAEVSAIAKQLDNELDRFTSIQQVSETPRTLLGQLKTS